MNNSIGGRLWYNKKSDNYVLALDEDIFMHLHCGQPLEVMVPAPRRFAWCRTTIELGEEGWYLTGFRTSPRIDGLFARIPR